MTTRKFFTYTGTFLVFLIAGSMFTDHFVKTDSTLPSVIEYIKSDPHIRADHGAVSEIHVKKRTKVNASPSSPPYNLYALHVVGEKKSGLIEVKAYLNPETLELESIQPGR